MTPVRALALQSNGFARTITIDGSIPNVGDNVILDNGTEAEFYNVTNFQNDEGEPMLFEGKFLKGITESEVKEKVAECFETIFLTCETDNNSSLTKKNKMTQTSPIEGLRFKYGIVARDFDLPKATINPELTYQDAANLLLTYLSYGFFFRSSFFVACVEFKAYLQATTTLLMENKLPLGDESIPHYPVFYCREIDSNKPYLNISKALSVLL
jgi:hypothetical protein